MPACGVLDVDVVMVISFSFDLFVLYIVRRNYRRQTLRV
jgi:hypothetical protein